MQTPETLLRAKVLEFDQQQQGDIEERLLHWIVGIKKSNERLIATLEQLRDSYTTLLRETRMREPGDLMSRVERVLSDARNARSLLMPESPQA